MTELQKHLRQLGACSESLVFAADKTAQETWETCIRPDWLLWWAARTGVNDKRALVRCAAIAARKVLHLVTPGEDRPRLAIEAAEKWCAEPTSENAYAAAAAAYAAAAAARAAYAAYAAAADAARAAAAAAAADTPYAAFNKELCEDIRRELSLPWSEGKQG